MSYRLLLPLVVAFAAPVETGFAARALAAETYRVSDPITHDNLTVYLLHGTSTPGPVPLTLSEALAKGAVTVHETGSVNQLQIENTGSEDIFVQAGDIVKGGRQDRVLTVSLIIQGNSGKVPIAAYCVEHGRWTSRGLEDAKRFATSDKAVPSRAAKMAMMAPAAPRQPQQPALGPRTGGNGPTDATEASARRALGLGQSAGPSRQSEVWASVAAVQDKLSRNLDTNVQAAASASSLQLTLENEKLAKARADYIAALKAKGESGDDIVGFAFAINGRLNSAEVYPSNGLFRKMWPKLLDASATEAIGEKNQQPSAAVPQPADVLAFLDTAEKGKASETRELIGKLVVEARDAPKAVYLETRQPSGAIVHRSYLAK